MEAPHSSPITEHVAWYHLQAGSKDGEVNTSCVFLGTTATISTPAVQKVFKVSNWVSGAGGSQTTHYQIRLHRHISGTLLISDMS